MKSQNFSKKTLTFLTLLAFVGSNITPFVPQTYALNTTYYIDATDGSDLNDGLSPETAWQSMSMASLGSGGYSEGDNILFECGESWAGSLDLLYSGEPGNPITYGRYGTCSGTNDPEFIPSSGSVVLQDAGSQTDVIVQSINFASGSVVIDGAGTNIAIENSSFEGTGNACIEQSDSSTLNLSTNMFTSCQIHLGSGATAPNTTIFENTFVGVNTTQPPIFSVSYNSGSSLVVQGNLFSTLSGGAIAFSANATIIQNTFVSTCGDTTDCAVVQNLTNDVGTSVISQNTFQNSGTGILTSGSIDAVRIEENTSVLSLTGNTFSNSQRSLVLSGANNVTIDGNTFYHPRTIALVIEEDIVDTTFSNTVSNNMFVTYNPDYPMVRIDDRNDASGSLATFSDNSFINVYKPKLPIIEVFNVGGDALLLGKNDLTTLDPGATNFTNFGYKVYTSTGSYSGSSNVFNGNFTSDIASWNVAGGSSAYNATGQTLEFTQDGSETGQVTSSGFLMVAGFTYEVTGTFKNNTDSAAKQVELRIHEDGDTNILYADRVIRSVATASGNTFTGYVMGTVTGFAVLSVLTKNPGNAYEFDNLSVRRVIGLTNNPRTNEVRLLINSGSSAEDYFCPGGGGCSLQYRDTDDNAISFPTNINAYSSKIMLWRDPNSDFTPTNILHKPTGSLVPSAGSVPNNTTVDLTWTSENATNINLLGTTSSGAIDIMLTDSGSMTILPPNDGTTTFTLNVENDIGIVPYTADIVTSNTPPITTNVFYSGFEESLSITGNVLATDINSGGSISYSLFDPPAVSQGVINSLDGDGLFDFTPANNFCGDATFTFRAFDAFGMGSDAISPGIATITVICTNDPPITIDDTYTSTGGVSNYLDVLINDTDIDAPYEAQTYYLTGFTNPAHGSLSITGGVFEYVPDMLYVGPDSFLYTMVDQSGALSNTGTVMLNVVPGSNLPPFVSGDSYVVTEDMDVAGTLSGYDLNAGDILTYSIATLPTNGIVTLSGADFLYTPNINYNGSDSFTFTADDTALTSSAATITFTVNGTPDLPVVVDDTIGVEMGAIVALDVMANDTDPDSPYSPQNLTITGYTLPSNGTLSVVGTGFQYISNSPFLGTDSFTYSIADGDGNISNTGNVTLNVSSTNTAPLAYSGSFNTDEDTALVGMLSGYDADATPLTFLLTASGSSGTISIGSTGGFVYTPNPNINGSDSFTFRVTDGVFTSASETVTVTILPVNDAPFAGHDTATGTEDTALVISDLLANDTDIDVGDTILLDSILTQGTNGTAVLSGTTEVVYTPFANFCGMDSFTYRAVDQSGATSATGNVAVNLNCTNDAPTIMDSSYTMTGNIEANSGNVLTGGLAATDIDLDTLTYTLGSGTAQGVLLFNTGGSFQYTPNLNYTGSDSFTYSATDGVITTATATVLITVNPNNFNIPPVAYSGSFSTNEDTPIVATLSGTDAEGSPLTFSMGSGVATGSLVLGSTGGFIYTPALNFSGVVNFTFRVNDGTYYSEYQTGIITIININDLPVGGNDSYTATEDTPQTFFVLENDIDSDGTISSITGLTQPSTGATVSISGTGILVTPIADYCSTTPITFNYRPVDNLGAQSVSANTVSVTITCVNETPIATDDIFSTFEDTNAIIPVLINDIEPDVGDSLSIVNLVGPSTGGTASVSGSGILITVAPNYCNTVPVSLTYRVRDSQGAVSNTGTVSLTVTCVNDLPTSTSGSYTMTGYTSTGTATSLVRTLTGYDLEGSTLTYNLISSVLTGTINVASTGGFVYTPPPAYVGGVSFTYASNDGSGSSAFSTISICIYSPDPFAERPSCAVGGGGPVASVGNGGGGGGSTTTYITFKTEDATATTNSSSYPTGVDLTQFRRVTSGSDVSNRLLRQLLLKKVDTTEEDDEKTEEETSDDDTSYESEGDDIIADTPFSTLLDGITTLVDLSREFSMSDGESIREIRFSGRDLVTVIDTDEYLSPREKAEALRAAARRIQEQMDPKPMAKEYKALQYVVRILSARQVFFEDMVESVEDLFDFETEE